MSYAQHLRDLLDPLRIYDMNGVYQGSELEALGHGFDSVESKLEEIEQEMNLSTAQNWGVDRMSALFRCRPVTNSKAELGSALTALMRIGADSFTPAAINDTIKGCGLNAQVIENGTPGCVNVIFPDVPGIPVDFEEISSIIESILPAHLMIHYAFWYITWVELEQKFVDWTALEMDAPDWDTLEKTV